MTDNETPDRPITDLAMTADRKRGMLTKGDRKLLLNEADYENEQQRRDARYRMRQHLKAALLDAFVVVGGVSLEECAAVLESIDREDSHDAEISSMILAKSLQDMAMMFLWAGFEHGGFEGGVDFGTDTETELAKAIQRSIQHATRRPEDEDRVIEVDVDIDITRGEIDETNIMKSMLRGSAHPEEVAYYLEHGDRDELEAQLDEMNAGYYDDRSEEGDWLGSRMTDEDGRPLYPTDEKDDEEE